MTTPRDPEPTRTREITSGALPAGHRLAGRYRILELSGVGGMGMVYRAFDEELEVEVAVKVLRAERTGQGATLERFRRELILGRQVSHPHVVRIHDIGQDGEMHFLTMDHVPGRSLEEVLAEEGPLAPERATEIIRQLATALAAAHGEGVIHRDLKPANVLLGEDGKAYITDFGVARSLAGSELTRQGAVVGTPSFLSPEQARGGSVDHRSDLYALGLILFEMLSGEPAFPGGSYEEILSQRISGRPRRLDELGVRAPAALRAVLRGCLARSPDRRFASAGELLECLEGKRPLSRQLRRGVLAAVALLVLGVVVAALLLWPRPGPSPQPQQQRAPGRAVGVLPLTDETGRPELAWVSTGLAEMLASNLSESSELRVSDSLRVLRILDDLDLAPGTLSPRGVRQLVELLDVDRLVHGRVRSLDGRLRVDGRLLGAGPGAEPEVFVVETAPGEDAIDLVEELAREVRAALAVEPPERPVASLTTSGEALAHHAAGTISLSRGESVEALPELEAAVAADPGFVAAWVRLADAYERLGRYEEALEAARRAITELQPGAGRIAFEARAQEAQLTGDLEEARRILEEMERLYPRETRVHLALGEAYGAQGRFEEAGEMLTRVVEREPSRARAWYLLGKFAILGGEARRAVDDYLLRALVLYNRLGSRQGKADVVNALGIAHQDLGELDEAARRFREAEALRREVGDRRGVAATLNNLAYLHVLEGDHAAARRALEQALEIHRELGDREGEAYIYNTFGTLEEERGRYRQALEQFRRALEIRRELGDERALAESYNNVGFCYYLLGEYDNAEVYWDRTLELYRQGENREGVVMGIQSLGLLALARGRWETALQSFVDSLELSREIDQRVGQAVALGNLGRLARYQGRYRAALSSLDEALAILEALDDPRGLAEFTLERAQVLVDLGRGEAAGDQLDTASGWVEALGNRDLAAELLRLQGERALLEGDIAAARRRLAGAAEEATASGGQSLELEVTLARARVALAADHAGEAVELFRGVGERAERLGHVPLRLAALEGLARAARATGDLEAADAAARRGVRLATTHAPWAGAYRLHALAATLSMARGAPEEARRHLERAASELARLRAELAPEDRRVFDALPAVRALEERLAAREVG